MVMNVLLAILLFDGRWIKMSHSLYKDLVQKSQNNISLLSEKEKKYIKCISGSRYFTLIMQKRMSYNYILRI